MTRRNETEKAIKKEWLSKVCLFMVDHGILDQDMKDAVKNRNVQYVCQRLQALTPAALRGTDSMRRCAGSRGFAARVLLKQYQDMMETAIMRRRLSGASVA